jgi:phosphoglycolate phosphatase-like HAD superfamily hydrolase
MTFEPPADAEGAEVDNLSQASAPLKTGWAGATDIQQSSAALLHCKPGFDSIAADAYLFDIDGTLLNSRDAVHYHAFHRAVREVFGLELQLDGIPLHGNTDVGILQAYLRAAGIEERRWRPRLIQVLEAMAAEVERNAADLRPEVCPAIPRLLDWLRSRGKVLGVASGNLERVGWAKLRACGLRDYFSFGAFSGALENRDQVVAHGLEQARALCGRDATVYVIGDTPADVRSAHANGISAIAVATGIYGFEELRSNDPEMCVSCCEDFFTNVEL